MRRLTFRKTDAEDIAAPIDGAVAIFVDPDNKLTMIDEEGESVLGSSVDATSAATSAANAATLLTAVENAAQFAMPFDAWLSRDNGIDPDLRGLNEATGMQDGDLASVAASDTGTHMQPGDFGDIEVANSGYYIYNGTGEYWQWQYPLDSTVAAGYAAGLASLFIQDTEPVVATSQYLWLDTSGTYLALYFEDGT